MYVTCHKCLGEGFVLRNDTRYKEEKRPRGRINYLNGFIMNNEKWTSKSPDIEYRI